MNEEKQLKGDRHIERHKLLHKHLEELVNDFVYHAERLPSKTTILELIRWSHKQTKWPDER